MSGCHCITDKIGFEFLEFIIKVTNILLANNKVLGFVLTGQKHESDYQKEYKQTSRAAKLNWKRKWSWTVKLWLRLSVIIIHQVRGSQQLPFTFRSAFKRSVPHPQISAATSMNTDPFITDWNDGSNWNYPLKIYLILWSSLLSLKDLLTSRCINDWYDHLMERLCLTGLFSLCRECRCRAGRWFGPAQCCPLRCVQCVPGVHGEELKPGRVPGHDGPLWDPHQWLTVVGYC